MTDIAKKLLTIAEVRKLTGSSQSAVYNWIREGRLAAKKLGRSTRITAESFDDFLNNLPAASVKSAIR